MNAIEDERCSSIVALPQRVDIQDALALGWSGDVTEDLTFHYCVHEKKGSVFKQVGEFDGCERGLISVGPPNVIKKLLS